MNDLLLYFAFPVATIILSIVVQKILRNEFLTAGTFFAIYLIVTFAAFDINFLIYAIAYTILSYITAVITKIIFDRIESDEEEINNCQCNRSEDFEKNMRMNNFDDKNNRYSNYFCRR